MQSQEGYYVRVKLPNTEMGVMESSVESERKLSIVIEEGRTFSFRGVHIGPWSSPSRLVSAK